MLDISTTSHAQPAPRRMWRKVARFGAVAAVALSAGAVAMPSPAVAEAAWQISVNRIDPAPQASGTQILFRVQLQCSAVDESICRDSEVRWPAQGLTTFSLPSPLHPTVHGMSLDGPDWVVDLQNSIAAGSSIEFDVLATSPNHITPDGEAFTIDATVQGSNTGASSDGDGGSWSASGDLGIEKYLQFGPDTDALLDLPVRYEIYPCDPNFDQSAPGHLYVENAVIVDTLPADVTVVGASTGGEHDPLANTVTWTIPGTLDNEDCDFVGPSDIWVEVIFDSDDYGPTSDPLQLEATNTVEISANPVGDPGTDLFDSDSLLHGFGLPNPIGTHTKDATTPYHGTRDVTFEDDLATYFVNIRTAAASTAPFAWRITDPMPCLDNTPNAATQYESNAFDGATGPVCANPAYQPDERIALIVDGQYLNIPDFATYLADHPTLPLRYRLTDGTVGSVEVPYLGAGWGTQHTYEIAWDDFAAAAGITATVGLSDLYWDSRDADLLSIPSGFDGRYAARLGLYGTVAPDTVAYPMLDQYRVRNYGHFNIYFNGEDTYLGAIQDDVIIEEETVVIYPTKRWSETTGLVTLDANMRAGALRAGESLIVTDLLPLGYEFGSWAQLIAGYGSEYSNTLYWSNSSGAGNTTGFAELDGVNLLDLMTLEIIDDYAGTGRQLVRASFPEPPVPGGWRKNPSALFRVSFWTNPVPANLSATNEFNVFPSDPQTAATLRCQATRAGTPRAANSADPLDLDADGVLVGDAWCGDTDRLVPPSTIVDVQAHKAVRGDIDPDFRPFPAIGAITAAGGTATFQLNLRNMGGISLNDLVVYDILPHVGDTGLSETQVGTGRGSDFDVEFAGIDPATVPAGAQIEYSTSRNPCRDELTTGATPFPSPCDVGTFSTTPPADLADVASLRITFPGGDLAVLDPAEGFAIEYDVTYPAATTPGQVAWNNFAYAADRDDTDAAILPAEPPKVGIGIPQIDLSVAKSVSPSAAVVGDPVTYTVTIGHDGSVTADGQYSLPASTATNVVLVDTAIAEGLTIVPGTSSLYEASSFSPMGASFDEATGTITIDEIGPNDSYVLTYMAYLAVEGQVDNVVQVVGADQPDTDSTPANDDADEDDYDTARANWVAADIDLRKLVETERGSGTFIEADAGDGLHGEYLPGQAVVYRFVVTNTGSARLDGVELTDDLAGYLCSQTIGSLDAGESVTIDCTWTFGFGDPATYVNTARVEGVPQLGGDPVTDVDSAEIVVVQPGDLALAKSVDANNDATYGATEQATVGVPFTYRLVVTNETLDVAATGVVVTDVLPAGVAATGGVTSGTGGATGGTFDHTTGVWTVGSVPAAGTATVVVTAVIADLAVFNGGDGTNVAEITAHDQRDADSTPDNAVASEDDRATATVTAVAAPTTTTTLAPTTIAPTTIALTTTIAPTTIAPTTTIDAGSGGVSATTPVPPTTAPPTTVPPADLTIDPAPDPTVATTPTTTVHAPASTATPTTDPPVTDLDRLPITGGETFRIIALATMVLIAGLGALVVARHRRELSDG